MLGAVSAGATDAPVPLAIGAEGMEGTAGAVLPQRLCPPGHLRWSHAWLECGLIQPIVPHSRVYSLVAGWLQPLQSGETDETPTDRRNMGGKDGRRGGRVPDAGDRTLPVRRRPCRHGRRPLLSRPLRRPRPVLLRRCASWPCGGLADLSRSRSTAPRPVASPLGPASEASPRLLVALPVRFKGSANAGLATLRRPPIPPMLAWEPGHDGHDVRDSAPPFPY